MELKYSYEGAIFEMTNYDIIVIMAYIGINS